MGSETESQIKVPDPQGNKTIQQGSIIEVDGKDTPVQPLDSQNNIVESANVSEAESPLDSTVMVDGEINTSINGVDSPLVTQSELQARGKDAAEFSHAFLNSLPKEAQNLLKNPIIAEQTKGSKKQIEKLFECKPTIVDYNSTNIYDTLNLTEYGTYDPICQAKASKIAAQSAVSGALQLALAMAKRLTDVSNAQYLEDMDLHHLSNLIANEDVSYIEERKKLVEDLGQITADQFNLAKDAVNQLVRYEGVNKLEKNVELFGITEALKIAVKEDPHAASAWFFETAAPYAMGVGVSSSIRGTTNLLTGASGFLASTGDAFLTNIFVNHIASDDSGVSPYTEAAANNVGRSLFNTVLGSLIPSVDSNPYIDHLTGFIVGRLAPYVTNSVYDQLFQSSDKLAKPESVVADRHREMFKLISEAPITKTNPDTAKLVFSAAIPNKAFINPVILVDELNKKQVDPYLFVRNVLGSTQSLEEALSTGQYIEFPLGSLGVVLAKENIDATQFSNHLSDSINGLSSDEFTKTQEDAQAQLQTMPEKINILSKQLKQNRKDYDAIYNIYRNKNLSHRESFTQTDRHYSIANILISHFALTPNTFFRNKGLNKFSNMQNSDNNLVALGNKSNNRFLIRDQETGLFTIRYNAKVNTDGFLNDAVTLYAEGAYLALPKQRSASLNNKSLYEFLGIKGKQGISSEKTLEFIQDFKQFITNGKVKNPNLAQNYNDLQKLTLDLYQVAKRFPIKLDKNIIDTFEPLLLSSKAIEGANSIAPLGIPEVVNQYKQSEVESRQQATIQLTQYVQQLEREGIDSVSSYYQDLKQKMNDKLTGSPDYNIYKYLSEGTSFGQFKGKVVKLDQEMISQQYGADFIEKLPSMTQKNGADPDVLAKEAGYRSGKELINGLIAMAEADKVAKNMFMQDMQKYTVKQQSAAQTKINFRANQLVSYGYRTKLFGIEEQEIQKRLLKQKGYSNDSISLLVGDVSAKDRMYYSAAQKILANKELTQEQVNQYLVNMNNANEEVKKSVSKKDWLKASDAMRKVRLNNELFLQSVPLLERNQKMQRIVDNIKNMNKNTQK